MKKKLVITALCIISIVLIYFGYLRYDQHKYLQSITPHVKNTSLRIANAVRFETDEGSSITFKEILHKLEMDIQEIDKRIFEVQAASTSRTRDVTDPVLLYLNSCQDLLMSLMDMNKKQLAVTTSKDWADKAMDEYKQANRYSADILYRTTTTTAIDKYQRCLRECDEATLDVLRGLTTLKEVRPKVGKVISADALTDPALFDSVIKKIKSRQSKSKAGAGA